MLERKTIQPRLVGVVAGTPFDTNLGCEYVRSVGLEPIPLPLTASAQEQTLLQLNKSAHQQRLLENIQILKRERCAQILIYCNAICTSVDLDFIQSATNVVIRTPLETYAKLSLHEGTLGVLAANAQCLGNIEKIIMRHNKDSKIIGLSLLPAIEAIENRIPPKEIINSYQMQSLIKSIADCGCKEIVLACTHFSYLWEELKIISDSIDGLQLIPSFLGILENSTQITGQVTHG